MKKSLLALLILFVAAGFVSGYVVAERAAVTPAIEPAPVAPQTPFPSSAARGAAVLPELSDIAERAIEASVNISSTQYVRLDPFWQFVYGDAVRPQTSLGSGVVVSPDGYILTNSHVIGNAADEIRVTLADNRELPARVVGIDEWTDLAVIKVDARGLEPLPWADSARLRVAEWVLAVGNPFSLSQTVTLGIVSAVNRADPMSNRGFIQTDAAINPGNSGGPLVNVRGEVVGVNSAIASENGFYQGYGFAIPANLARVVGNQLIADGRVRRSVLGVAIDDADEWDAAYAGFTEVRGVVVNDYSMPNSPAEKAGIEPGDLIVELDGEPVYYVAQLQQLVGFKAPGSTVKVTVVRKGGVRRTATVRLIEAPNEQVAQAATRERERPREDTAGTTTALGISVRQPPSEIASRLGDDLTGVVVMDVEAGSPAQDRLNPARNGISDIITHVNATRVRTVDQFEQAIRATRPGEIVSLRVYNATAEQSRVERVRVPR